ncbi:class IV lanthionine synthetase LanL [Microbispora sp. NPDC046973]|uniref:class IV lanthionine synthetase LanL n=1 Tax=Microbispora sp. NPDC046973 TaxID=3155022 RepID=UPI0033D06C96
MADNAGTDELGKVLQAALEEIGRPDNWGVRTEPFWCYVEPPGYGRRLQGWKLHVSATGESAPLILQRAAKVLLERRACFKFAKSLVQVAELTSMRHPRASSGKFITVYPDDDEHFRVLAEELHQATEGLAGPSILSDLAYRPKSLVHYRYGGFTNGLTLLDMDGSYIPMLVAPDGSWMEDRREAYYTAPAWAPPPLPATPAAKPDEQRGGPVLIAGRFEVDEAVRQSSRGGVYRAADRRDGARVILKEARPHIAAARTLLRREAEMLDLLAPLGITPRKVALLEYQDHLFLAEEEIPGSSLRKWVADRSREESSRRPPSPEVLALAGRLVDMVTLVHDTGLVLRDLTPGNVVVTPDGVPRLVDLEFAAWPGEPVVPVMTPGYTAPEQSGRPAPHPAPSCTADLYSLGACLLYLCSGVDPVFPSEDEPARTAGERMELLVRTAAHGNDALRRLAPLVLGLTATNPGERWDLTRARAFLRGDAPGPAALDVIAVLTPGEQDELLRDLLHHIVRQMNPEGRHLWPPVVHENRMGDPCSVHTGAGGILPVLNRAILVLDDPRCHEALAVAAARLNQELWREPRVLPGLFFGRSGAAWALYEAARTLGDEGLSESALRYAKRIPLRWPVPDYTHGTAGAGVAQLALWRATGDPEFRVRARFCADRLVDECEHRGDEVLWPIPEGLGSKLGGLVHYGLAHGVAGIATFLLSAGQALEEPRYTSLAVACGRMLQSKAERLGDIVRWPVGPERANRTWGAEPDTAWWCNGAGGIGAFLIRLWRATGETGFREIAEMAASAVRNERWALSHIHCHGNAGNGELLLDMAAVLGDDRYLTWAAELAACIHSGHVRRDGRKLIPPQATPELSWSYNMGLAGIAGFLLRLRHGGRRWFMHDDFSLEAPAR